MSKWHPHETPAEHWFRKETEPNRSIMRFPGRYSPDWHADAIAPWIDKLGWANVKLDDKIIIERERQMLNAHTEFCKFGRPTYLVDKNLFEICESFSISDEDYEYIFEKLPYPCFMLLFEKGCKIQGFELCSATVVGQTDTFDGIILFSWDDMASPSLMGNMSSKPVGVMSNSRAILFRHVVAALVMLWRSRPEFVVGVTLPRSERYNFKGDRKLIRTWKFPDKLIVRKPHGESESTGRHVKAHWRAGHFRHYRHERYARELDGSAKVELIAPCVIHADELSKESDHGA